jgi:hypothetical protein
MAVVEPEHLATLNTVVAMSEGGVSLVMAPTMGWLLGAGLKIGGAMTGLLYYVVFGIVCLACIPVFTFKIPAGMS